MMTDDAWRQKQQQEIESVRALVSKGLARPPRLTRAVRLNHWACQRFLTARVYNPLVYLYILALPSDAAFGYALYWFFLRRSPDLNGLRGLFRSLYDQSLSRPDLMRRYMLAPEACEKRPSFSLLRPLDHLLRLSAIFLSLPLVGWGVRLAWRLATLPAYLKDREWSRYESETMLGELEMQKEDFLEYQSNDLAVK